MPYDTVGVFDLRHWDCNMPEHVSARDFVYVTDVPDMVADALRMNGCETSTENFDLMTRAAAGLLEGHTHQMLSGKIGGT